MTQNTQASDRHHQRPSEDDTAYLSPDVAAAAYDRSNEYLADLDAWAIDEISKDGAIGFVIVNTFDRISINYRRSTTYATAVDDIFQGARELS